MAEIQPVSRDGRVVCACNGKEYNVRDAIDAGIFTIELIFEGAIDRLSKQWMWRLAARRASKELDPNQIAAEREKFFERAQIEPAKAGDWLGKIGRDQNWLEEMCAMEAAYRAVYE